VLKVEDAAGKISFVDIKQPTASVHAQVESRLGAICRPIA